MDILSLWVGHIKSGGGPDVAHGLGCSLLTPVVAGCVRGFMGFLSCFMLFWEKNYFILFLFLLLL